VELTGVWWPRTFYNEEISRCLCLIDELCVYVNVTVDMTVFIVNVSVVHSSY